MIAEVIVDIANSEVDKIFDYSASCEIQAGSRVFVPFGKRQIEGYVIRLKEKSDYDQAKIKDIISMIDPYPVIGQEMLELMHFMVKKYHLRYVDVLRLFIPSQMRGGKVKELVKQFAYLNPEFLNKDVDEFIKPNASSQRDIFYYLLDSSEESVTELNKSFSAAALRNLIMRDIVFVRDVSIMRTPYKDVEQQDKKVVLTQRQEQAIQEIDHCDSQTLLLHGVTGSGKTEVYMQCIARTLQKNKTAIMLVPEIALTPQVLRLFRSRFQDSVAILHSALSAGERFDEWRRLLSGEAKIAVGARSAIFAPLKDIGLIIIDEEHDPSYISENNPRYATIDIAHFRRTYNNCKLVLGSATPSIESYQKAIDGEYSLINLPERINRRALPEIIVVNMLKEYYDGNTGIFSRKLESELKDCMENNNQAMIFINRRGYSSYVLCRNCGYIAKCTRCDVSLVYHKEENVLKCHYCGNRYAMLDLCPECKSPHIRRGYVGTEQVVEKLKAMFKDKKILRMDNDTTQSKDSHFKILNDFSSKKASILVGTQMIAKGHDFPDVTLVGIIDADMSLHFSDFRSCERTYQLITQVSGRAGRESKSGKVVLQTFSPNHYVYKFATLGDYKSFFDKEANLRQVTKFPPFSNILRILISSEDEALATESLKQIFEKIKIIENKNASDFAYFAAMRSPLKKLQDKYRLQIIMRIVNNFDEITQMVYNIIDEHKNSKVSCFVEINPSSMS